MNDVDVFRVRSDPILKSHKRNGDKKFSHRPLPSAPRKMIVNSPHKRLRNDGFFFSVSVLLFSLVMIAFWCVAE